MILDKIVEKKKIRVEEMKKLISIDEMYMQANVINEKDKTNEFKEVLQADRLSIIGEFKKSSPSKGIIVPDFNINKIYDYYSEIEVDAFSILTEEDYFLGNNGYINTIRKKSKTPILRKDFIFDSYQIYETKVLGAQGILLIVAVLKDEIGKFYNEAKKLNLVPLVEVHTKDELDIALSLGCEVIGINNRDLKTFNTTLTTTENLIKHIPKNNIVISESGINTIEHLEFIKNLGVNGVLVGEMFMRNINNEEFIKDYRAFRNGGN